MKLLCSSRARIAAAALVFFSATCASAATLTVSRTGDGQGTVTNAQISCGTICSADYPDGATVVLTAQMAHGSKLFVMQGCNSTGVDTCTVVMSGPKTVEFAFRKEAIRNDMGGDGRSDLIWYNTATHTLIQMGANGQTLSPPFVMTQSDANWRVAGIADLNANGCADIVWQNNATGAVYGMIVDGCSQVTTGRPIASEGLLAANGPQWKLEQVTDVGGNGRADLVMRNQQTGEVQFHFLNGLSNSGWVTLWTEPNFDWQIVASGDINGDSKSDLLWRNSVTGDVFAMFTGTDPLTGAVIYSEPNTNWKIVGLADFNGDRRADLLWQNTLTGDVYQMQMDGTTILGGQFIYNEPNTAWKIVATGDYNGDGKADILWRNTATGQVFMLLMNGFAIAGGGFVYTEPDQNWKILGP